MMIATICINTDKIEDKIKSLSDAISSRFPDGIPEGVESELSGLCDDIILTDMPSTISANGINQIVQAADFGIRFDAFAAALRAGDFDIHTNLHRGV